MRAWLREHLPVRTSTAVITLFFVAILAWYVYLYAPFDYQSAGQGGLSSLPWRRAVLGWLAVDDAHRGVTGAEWPAEMRAVEWRGDCHRQPGLRDRGQPGHPRGQLLPGALIARESVGYLACQHDIVELARNKPSAGRDRPAVALKHGQVGSQAIGHPARINGRAVTG